MSFEYLQKELLLVSDLRSRVIRKEIDKKFIDEIPPNILSFLTENNLLETINSHAKNIKNIL